MAKANLVEREENLFIYLISTVVSTCHSLNLCNRVLCESHHKPERVIPFART